MKMSDTVYFRILENLYFATFRWEEILACTKHFLFVETLAHFVSITSFY
jgi:hypothetical protein